MNNDVFSLFSFVVDKERGVKFLQPVLGLPF
jgi:hypothetical protein